LGIKYLEESLKLDLCEIYFATFALAKRIEDEQKSSILIYN